MAEVEIGVDIGGTFTDLVAISPDRHSLVTKKVLNSPAGPAETLAAASREAGIEPDTIRSLVHGTTFVTNLLIERKGSKIGLITSRGFRDVLEIGYSFRQRTFDFGYEKTPPLVPRHLRTEVGGRIDCRGREKEPLSEPDVEAAIRLLQANDVEVVAVALYNSYANGSHERRVAEIVRRLAPELHVVLSVDVDARVGEYERTSTCVLNAMAVPRFMRYADDLESGFRIPGDIRYMHSGGGVLTGEEARLRPLQLAYSGPAGGALAGREVARQLGFRHAITMDMGGTSCDVCLIYDGELRSRQSVEFGHGIPARIQSLDIHTVGAGGGSIVHVDARGGVRVGPHSAGAVPGPACYGRGGREPTVTDANLLLGILPSQGLLGGRVPLHRDSAAAALTTVAAALGTKTETVARGVWSLVNANIAQAIRQITVHRGVDPRDCVLIVFGGAGPQHAAGIASELGIANVVVPAHCSVLSAIGLLSADLKVTAAQTLLVPLSELDNEHVKQRFEALYREAFVRLGAPHGEDLISENFVGLRYVGQWHYVPLLLRSGESKDAVYRRFEAEHETLFGTRLGGDVEIVDAWVTLTRPRRIDMGSIFSNFSNTRATRALQVESQRRVHLETAAQSIPVYLREDLEPDRVLRGPCLVEELQSVTYAPTGSRIQLTPEGHLLLRWG